MFSQHFFLNLFAKHLLKKGFWNMVNNLLCWQQCTYKTNDSIASLYSTSSSQHQKTESYKIRSQGYQLGFSNIGWECSINLAQLPRSVTL